MALDSHLNTLKQKHDQLEHQLTEVMKHPGSRDDEIAELKRQKLVIKDKIEKIKH